MICRQFLVVAMLAAVSALGTGCATNYHETADREQRASDQLRTAGARDAARAAQSRSDVARKAGSCDGFLECAVDALFSMH